MKSKNFPCISDSNADSNGDSNADSNASYFEISEMALIKDCK